MDFSRKGIDMRLNLALIFCVLVGVSGVAFAQDRAGTWDVGFQVIDMSSELLTGSQGSSLDVDDEIGYGFTGAYNFTNRFAVGLDLNWASPDYTATRILEGTGQSNTIRAELDVVTIQAKGIFYFLEGDITPFVEAGVGWTEVDSNIVDGPPTTGCWWDPWWGYICQSFFDTYSDTRTSYSASVGLRWDLAPEFTLRGSIGLLEIDTDRATEDAEFDTLRVDFAWRF